MLELIQWLRENIPAEDGFAGSRTGIVHGDFRLDNLVFHPTEVRPWLLHSWPQILENRIKAPLSRYFMLLAIFSLGCGRRLQLSGCQLVRDTVFSVLQIRVIAYLNFNIAGSCYWCTGLGAVNTRESDVRCCLQLSGTLDKPFVLKHINTSFE